MASNCTKMSRSLLHQDRTNGYLVNVLTRISNTPRRTRIRSTSTCLFSTRQHQHQPPSSSVSTGTVTWEPGNHSRLHILSRWRLSPYSPSHHSFSSSTTFSASDKNDEKKNDEKKKNDDKPHPQPNAFQLFQMEPRFDLDLNQLQQTYRALMNEHHPDRHYASVATSSKSISSVDPSSITQAYQQLKDPYTRALLLLELHGNALPQEGTTHSDSTSDNDGNKTADFHKLVDMEFLMHVMELREEAEQVVRANDNSDSQRRLQSLWNDNQQRIKAIYSQLNQAFGSDNFAHAQVLTAQLQYWNRLQEFLKEHVEDIRHDDDK